MENDDFLVGGLFYIPHTKAVYHMKVKFNSTDGTYPKDNIYDIRRLIDIINNGSIEFPYNAICVDIDVIINMSDEIIWSHIGEISYHSGIKLYKITYEQNYEQNEEKENEQRCIHKRVFEI